MMEDEFLAEICSRNCWGYVARYFRSNPSSMRFSSHGMRKFWSSHWTTWPATKNRTRSSHLLDAAKFLISFFIASWLRLNFVVTRNPILFNSSLRSVASFTQVNKRDFCTHHCQSRGQIFVVAKPNRFRNGLLSPMFGFFAQMNND